MSSARLFLDDGREARVGDRVEVWDAGRCVRVLRPASPLGPVRFEGGFLRDGQGLDWDVRDVFLSLQGVAVLVVGGTRGIGRALAEACRRRGAEVSTCGRAACDVTDPAAVEAFLRAHARLDVVVYAAALPGGALGEVLDVNVAGALHVGRALLRRAERCRFVGVSSGVVDTPVAGAAEYVASKHGLEGVVRAHARDAEGTEVTFTAVRLGACPEPHLALAPLLGALVAPPGEVHGRVLSAAPMPRPIDTSQANEFASPLGPSPRALAAVAETTALARYPDPEALELRHALAARHDVELERVVVGAGASDLLERALRVLGERGERIVAHSPSWLLFPALCTRLGLALARVPYRIDRQARRIDHHLDAISARVDRSTRLVYLVSPSNPLGVALDEEPFARFFRALPSHVTVIVDEAYADYIVRSDALRADAWARSHDRIVVLRSFSKLHGLAALRVGYALASPALAARLAEAGLPFAVSAVAQAAACAALADEAHAARVREAALDARARAGPTAFPSDAPFWFDDDGGSGWTTIA